MGRKKIHDAALRVRLLDRAGELLSAGGPDALNLRRLAADVGTSTTAVYSLFGSKADLMQALLTEGFRRLREHLDAVARHDDPIEHLVRLSYAYHASARSDPHYYRVMFETRRAPMNPEVEELGATAFQPLLAAVRRCIGSGAFPALDPDLVALALWSQVHGLVSLELSRFLREDNGYDDTGFDTIIRTGLRGWQQASPRSVRTKTGSPG